MPMANKQEDHLVKCPYNRGSKSQVILCEGIEEGVGNNMTFDTHDHLIDYKNRFCRKMHYGECPWAEVLNKKKYDYE